jgi:glycosyltransferase involved in cell wall biosynthesis
MKKLNWMLLMQRVVREAALVCFTTEAEQGVAAAALVGVGTPQAVVPLGVGGPPKPAAELRRAWKQTHPDLADARVLLFLGRLHPKKGCDLLITGYARWRKEHGEAAAGYHLRMVGPAMSDGYLRELHDRCTAEELEAGKDVSFPGMLTGEAKWQELAAAEAFVLPSYQENFGLAVGEALALGTPVLLSDKVNLWPWIAEGEAGFVAPPSVDGVTDLLTQWAALDEAERDGMKRRALTLYQAKFSPVKAAARFVRMVADASRKPVPQR